MGRPTSHHTDGPQVSRSRMAIHFICVMSVHFACSCVILILLTKLCIIYESVKIK